MIAVGIMFLVPIPLLLAGVNRLVQSRAIAYVAWVSVIAGAGIDILFSILLAIESVQDRKMNKYWLSRRKARIRLGGGKYECGACGNRNVCRSDAVCGVCGTKFETDDPGTPGDIPGP